MELDMELKPGYSIRVLLILSDDRTKDPVSHVGWTFLLQFSGIMISMPCNRAARTNSRSGVPESKLWLVPDTMWWHATGGDNTWCIGDTTQHAAQTGRV